MYGRAVLTIADSWDWRDEQQHLHALEHQVSSGPASSNRGREEAGVTYISFIEKWEHQCRLSPSRGNGAIRSIRPRRR
jgi:hypothetical protein